MRWGPATLATLITVCSVAAAGAQTGDWLELIDTTRLPVLREDVCLQVSSYDRTGGNDDGFSGTHSYLRKEGDAFVIFEDVGPGCIYRIWSANPGARRIEFYFDGETEPRLVFDRWEDMFLDKAEPFLRPVSGHDIGGFTSYVPIPYAKSLKIVTRERINFYQITYMRFAEAEGVASFSPTLTDEARAKFERVCQAWRNLGSHPWPEVLKETVTETAKIESGDDLSASISGSGLVHALEIGLDTEDPKILRRAVLRITAGRAAPQVLCPVGDFFLQGFPGQESRSLLCGVKPAPKNRFYSYWPMPFSKGIEVELVNESQEALTASITLRHEPVKQLNEGLGFFHAKWLRQNPTTAGTLFPILETKGRGHWCGVSVAMQGFQPGLGFLEGDEMLWIDDRGNATFNGTGSEDYYNGGWYFGTTGSFPYFGCGYYGPDEGRCHAFRVHMTDLVPFQQQARIGIEHGHANEYEADYAGVTFWYAESEGGTAEPDLPEPADRMWTSVKAAGFTEAEEAFAEGTGAEVTEDSLTPLFFSGGKALALKGPKAEARLRFTIPEDGIYEPVLRFAGGSPPAALTARVDETAAAAPSMDEADDGRLGKARLARGDHILHVALPEGEVLLDAFRLVPSPRVEDAIEAETLAPAPAGEAVISVQDLEAPGASGDAHLGIACPQKGAGATFTWNVERPGGYAAWVRLLGQPQGHPVQVMLDGKALGSPIETRAEKAGWLDPVCVGVTPPLPAGAHALAVTSAAEGATTLGVDYFLLKPEGFYEAEELKQVEVQSGPCDIQKMGGFAGTWSGGAQIFFRPAEANGVVTFEAEVQRPGTRVVSVFFTQAPDYGTYRLLVNGNALGDPFDGYAPGVVRSNRIIFGEYDFKAGKCQFRFECVGKHEKSTGHFLGLDVVFVE